MNWINLAQDRNSLRAFVEKKRKLTFAFLKVGNFVTKPYFLNSQRIHPRDHRPGNFTFSRAPPSVRVEPLNARSPNAKSVLQFKCLQDRFNLALTYK